VKYTVISSNGVIESPPDYGYQCDVEMARRLLYLRVTSGHLNPASRQTQKNNVTSAPNLSRVMHKVDN